MKTVIQQLLEALEINAKNIQPKDIGEIMILIKTDYIEIEKNMLAVAFKDGMETYAGKPVETELDFEQFYNETFKKIKI